jgi:hypothetical protein
VIWKEFRGKSGENPKKDEKSTSFERIDKREFRWVGGHETTPHPPVF